jgi:hypothetical protein
MLLRFHISHPIGHDERVGRVAVVLDLKDDLSLVDAGKSVKIELPSMGLAGFDLLREFGFVFGCGGHGGHDTGKKESGIDTGTERCE